MPALWSSFGQAARLLLPAGRPSRATCGASAACRAPRVTASASRSAAHCRRPAAGWGG